MGTGSKDVSTPQGYAERLTAPLRWYVQATMLLATFWIAMIVALSGVVAWLVAAGIGAVGFALLTRMGWARVEVTAGELRAGRARIPLSLVGGAEPLDAENTRRVLGVDADVRAYLLTRPYLKRSVRVALIDPADPTPYWLISTRRPDHLAAAITAAKAGSRSGR